MDIVLLAIATVGTLLVLGVLAAGRLLHCNDETYKQRSELIALIATKADLDVFQSVSYHKHIWTMFFFGNPYNLYVEAYQTQLLKSTYMDKF